LDVISGRVMVWALSWDVSPDIEKSLNPTFPK
jgi:hypothetical protein